MQSPDQGRNRTFDRRTAIGVLSSLSIAAAGCSSSTDATTPSEIASKRVSVPLRVVLVGKETEAEAITRFYETEAERTIRISAVSPDNNESIVDLIKNADVAIMSHSLLGRLVKSEAIVEFNADVVDELSARYGKPLTAIANTVGKYDSKTWGMAVGAKPFAVLSRDPDLNCDRWNDYHEWVKNLDKKAAEPLAPTWAANSFLNRCALRIDRGWLFNRLSLEPQINEPEYVETLQQLQETSKLYASLDLTPSEVFDGIRRGNLRGGIGFETTMLASENRSSADVFDVSVFDCPNETETDRVWLGPQTTLACVSTGCRQSEASRQFIGWLSGGNERFGVYQQSDRMGPTRVGKDELSTGAGSGYSRWLREHLKATFVSPGLWIPGGPRYYDVLDREVRRCISEEVTAQEALDTAAGQWNAITDDLGREEQIVQWRKVS